MRRLMAAAAIAAFAALALLPAAAASAGSPFGHPWRHGFGQPTPGAAVVSLESGPYGPVLVVGGAGAGYVPATATAPASYLYPAGSSLYMATVDRRTHRASLFHPYQAGCGTTVVDTESQGALSCTGSETDPTADWPAFTTEAPPVAGPGVDRWLLGAVYRPDLQAFQVTYAGHPLYLFDPGPNSFMGANFVETVEPLPPWHTFWYLLAPDGLPATGPATLETESPQPGTVYDSPQLAAQELPGIGGAAVSLYSFSGDTPWSSRCAGPCARLFTPLLTVGTPTSEAGVNAGAIGEVTRANGTHQVTYDGHPLYMYSQEQALLGSSGPLTNGTAGNGNGVQAFGGTFSLVSP